MNELTYTMQGDYNLPDLTMPEAAGSDFGQVRSDRGGNFSENVTKIWYYNLLTSCTLTQHLAEYRADSAPAWKKP